MRIRIQTHSPLPDVKAWFIPDEHNSPETIFDLKEELCQRVQALKNADYHGHSLVLLLEDFELLNDSPFGAVRDGDLICIKQRSPPKVAQVDVQMESVDGSAVKTHGKKRKRSQAPTVSAPAPNKFVGKAPITAPIKPRVAPEPVKPVDAESDYDSDTSSTSSSSSSSSSSTSSSKSTSSSSSSSTSSSSSSSSAPEPLSSKKPTMPTPQLNVTQVPPGLGKASTHSRNNRRRKKREFAKLETNLGTTPLKGASETNTTPLGAGAASTNKPRPCTTNLDPASIPLPPSPSTITAPLPATQPPPSSTRPARKKARVDDENTPAQDAKTKGGSANGAPAPVYITQDQVMMSSMRNKNKKKGFKLSMANPIPQKITFGDDTTTSTQAQSQSQSQSQTTVEPTQVDPSTLRPSTTSTSVFHSTAPVPYARLVPPSEIQNSNPEKVPSNMIITSVDIEAGMWDDTASYAVNQDQSFAYDQATPNGKKKRGKGKGKDKDKKGQQTGGRGYGEEEYFEEGQFADESVWDAGIPADVDETMLDYGGAEGDADRFDWDRAEKVWDSKSTIVVSTPEQLVAGKYVGWKALAINPRTFSPEVLLSVARVVAIQDEANGKAVLIKAIERSSDSETAAAFGFMDGLSGEDGEETIDWSEVLSSQWQLLDL